MSENEATESASPKTAAASEAKAAEAKFLSVEMKDIIQEYPRPDQTPHRVVDGLSLKFSEPGINMLLGPSGCGKSTLLRMMGGVRPTGVATPTSGQVLIGGQPCDGAHDDAVMVFQRYANRPDLTIYNNVALPFEFSLWKKRLSAADRKKRVDEALEMVGIADKKNLRPSQLSGGQNQRVALARALVLRPKILLMDEPFGALDAQTREGMQRLLIKLWDQQPCLVIFVTHDVSEALVLGDRVIVLSANPANVVDDFPINEPRPRSDAWLMSTPVVQLKDRILSRLHANTHGQVRVSF